MSFIMNWYVIKLLIFEYILWVLNMIFMIFLKVLTNMYGRWYIFYLIYIFNNILVCNRSITLGWDFFTIHKKLWPFFKLRMFNKNKDLKFKIKMSSISYGFWNDDFKKKYPRWWTIFRYQVFDILTLHCLTRHTIKTCCIPEST